MPRGRGRRNRQRGRSMNVNRSNRYNNYKNGFSQLYRDVMFLKSMINVESKYIDTLFSSNTMANGIGNQSLLNGCTTGVTSVTRTGQSIKSKMLRIDIIIAVGATTPVNCRVCIIQDKAANGSTIGIGSIFQAAVDGASDYTTSQRNVATLNARVVFHMDDVFELDTVQNTRKIIRTSIPLKFHTHYNTGTAGTVADISENSLYLLAMSSAGATQPTFKGSIRYEFIDN